MRLKERFNSKTSSDDTGMLVGIDDTLEDAWDGLEQVIDIPLP